MNHNPEPRICDHCGHTGDDNDQSDDVSCCLYCEESQPNPCEDHCTHCGRDNVMGLACPECGGPYRLDYDRMPPNGEVQRRDAAGGTSAGTEG